MMPSSISSAVADDATTTMSDIIHSKNLGSTSFRGAQLANADFTGADIRGADFEGASLTGAKFDHCRAGVSRRWSIVLIVLGMIVALIAGAIIGFVSTVPAFILRAPPPAYTDLHRIWGVVGTCILFAIIMGMLLLRGTGLALAALAIWVAITALGGLVLPPEYTVINFFLMLLIGAAIAGVVQLAAVLAVALEIGGRGAAAGCLLCTVLAIVPAMWEGIHGFAPRTHALEPLILALSLLLAGVYAVVTLGSALLVARTVLNRHKRYILLERVVISILGWRGTSFRQADLTDASFSHAHMGHTDLRGATILRTNWYGANQLELSRHDQHYLVESDLCRLAISKDGSNQKFDHADLQGMNLADANLQLASLIDANLAQATLRQANLEHAVLVRTQLHQADLSGACLTGATIEGWGIATDTKFDAIECDYLFMRLPSRTDPDPWRKPDNRDEKFQQGDFADFVAPIIKTLDLYRHQYLDPRTVGRAFTILDLYHYNDVDATASVIALIRLSRSHPEARIEVMALEGYGNKKLKVQAAVDSAVDRSALSAEYELLYTQALALPQAERAAQLDRLGGNVQGIGPLKDMVASAIYGDKFYMETRILLAPPVKCLLFAAVPIDQAYLQVDIEFRKITEKVQASKYRDVIDLIYVPAARPGDILQAMNMHRPQVVQFSGHGSGDGQIMLMNDAGIAQAVSAAALEKLFAVMKGAIKLVILNACYSDVQAVGIVKAIDCVIGMSDAIADDHAIEFIAAVYGAMGFGCSVKEAYEQGIAALMLESTNAENQPHLHSRAGVDPCNVFLIETTGR
jgi:uncharacterized protein YjbI with pentapeptide repeats